MDGRTYRLKIQRTMNKDLTEKEKLTMLAMGIAGEAGEIVDSIKKHIFHEHPLDFEDLVKELGDLEWYLQHLKSHYEIPDELVRRKNIQKLEGRYPHGFDPLDSLHREV